MDNIEYTLYANLYFNNAFFKFSYMGSDQIEIAFRLNIIVTPLYKLFIQ